MTSTHSSKPTAHRLLAFFVYGTLKPGGMYYQSRCQAYAPEAIPAVMPGRLYHLPGLEYPAVTVGDDRIEGFVLRFQNPEILTLLDEVEEYDPQDPDNSLYFRQQISVESEQGPLDVWVYLMHPEQVMRLGGIYDPGGVWDHLAARPKV